MSNALVLDPNFFRDPYSTYAMFREAGGAHEVILPSGHKVWVVARYDDARAALVDPRLSKNLGAATSLFDRHLQDSTKRGKTAESVIGHMLNSDPPDHTRLRRLVGKAFTAHRIQALRPRVERIADELLDTVSERHGTVDLVKEFAFPLPTIVLGEVLGVPEHDRDLFCGWVNSIVEIAETGSPERQRDNTTALAGYLAQLVLARRTDPGDDVLSALVHASHGTDRLTDLELVMTAFLLLVAGHDTTVGLIGNGVFALLCHPEQRDALLADPGLVPGAVEELLRFSGPANFSTLRYTTSEVEIGDRTIPEGEFVVIALNSANHDPQRFADPETLDIRRSAGGHLAFGHGIHHCVGASLARLEGEVAIGRLLHRFPNLGLAADDTDIRWLTSTLLRGMEQLPVLLGHPGE